MRTQIDYLLDLLLDARAEHGVHSPEAKRADERLSSFIRSIRDHG